MKRVGFGRVSWFRSRDVIEKIFIVSCILELIIGSIFGIIGQLFWTIIFIGSALATFIMTCICDHYTS